MVSERQRQVSDRQESNGVEAENYIHPQRVADMQPSAHTKQHCSYSLIAPMTDTSLTLARNYSVFAYIIGVHIRIHDDNAPMRVTNCDDASMNRIGMCSH